MPSRTNTTGDSCEETYTVKYIDMTEEQESQWIRELSLLCLEMYEESILISPIQTDQCDTMPSQ